jgi:hypothetical protein
MVLPDTRGIIMYYERTETGWEPRRKQSIYFNGSTYPIESLPPDFWDADRMKGADLPSYDTATEKLVGPQEIGGGFVGYVVESLTPEEIEAAYQATIPTVVTMRKARVYLVRNNLLDTINSVVASQGQEAIETWNTSHEVQRTNPLLNYVLDSQGYSELDKDQMFIDADKL